jgi:hypothetical protein
MQRTGKGIPGRGNSLCKGPGAGGSFLGQAWQTDTQICLRCPILESPERVPAFWDLAARCPSHCSPKLTSKGCTGSMGCTLGFQMGPARLQEPLGRQAAYFSLGPTSGPMGGLCGLVAQGNACTSVCALDGALGPPVVPIFPGFPPEEAVTCPLLEFQPLPDPLGCH